MAVLDAVLTPWHILRTLFFTIIDTVSVLAHYFRRLDWLDARFHRGLFVSVTDRNAAVAGNGTAMKSPLQY